RTVRAVRRGRRGPRHLPRGRRLPPATQGRAPRARGILIARLPGRRELPTGKLESVPSGTDRRGSVPAAPVTAPSTTSAPATPAQIPAVQLLTHAEPPAAWSGPC